MTLVHPAAILPLVRLSRTRGWKTALVLGAMAPDLVRLLPGVGRELSHSLLGLGILVLPFTLVLAPLISRWVLPRAMRLPGLAGLVDPKERFGWEWAILGAILGGGTHLFWDLFTHDGGPTIPSAFLDTKIMDSVAGPIRIRHLAWGLHSLLGAGVLVAALAWILVRSPGGPRTLLHPTWIRLATAFTLPIAWLYYVSATHGIPFYEDAILLVRIASPWTRPALLLSALGTLGLFFWETRRRST